MASGLIINTIILLAGALPLCSTQTSCRGRCGADYYRGSMCQCDYECLLHEECCKDYETQCTTKKSCKGRCGEPFRRGRLCSCDNDCTKYKQCCPDYHSHCPTEETPNGPDSIEAPAQPSSCDNVNSNKPKDPPLNKPVEEENVTPLIEEDNPDFIPAVTPASDPQDDDVYDQMFTHLPDDPYSESGQDEPVTNPNPEGTSGYELSQTDLPETEPADLTESSTPPSQTEDAPANPSTCPPSKDGAPTDSGGSSDPNKLSETESTSITGIPTSPAVSHISSQPTQSSMTQPGPTPTDYSQDEGSGALAELTQNADPTKPSPDQPEVVPSDPDFTQAATTPASSASPTTVPPSIASTQGSTPDLTPASPDVTTAISDTEGTGENVTDTPIITPIPSVLDDPNASDSPSPDVGTGEDTTEGGNKPGAHNELVTSPPAPTHPAEEETVEGVTTLETVAATKTPPPKATSEPQAKPVPPKPTSAKPNLTRPVPKPKPSDSTPALNIDKLTDYQADDSNDTNLCSGRPATALTTLRNGTVVVFRGHYFWMLDRYRVPGPARGITEVWGVPSPLDTVFTRCNCQGKTYIFKGAQYWRFDNDVVDPGYPKPMETGFDGLRGHITAALSVPQYKQRKESVYFFKRGGLVQKYSYQFGTSPTCGRKPSYAVYTVRNRVARQAASFLGPSINIRLSWKDFPSTVTSAVSVPSRLVPEGYKYYVFSRSKYYSVRLDDERPVVAAPPPKPLAQTKAAEDFFKCPKTV